jgi:hypothetical protein
MHGKGLDQDGFIEREGSLARVQEALAPVVTAAKMAFLSAFTPGRLHSAYLYGVARHRLHAASRHRRARCLAGRRGNRSDWRTREQHLCAAYQTAAALHNELGLTQPLDTGVRRFYDRPHLVIDAARFTTALREAITDPRLRELPLTGAVDQFIDSTDALGSLHLMRASTRSALSGERQSAPEAT